MLAPPAITTGHRSSHSRSGSANISSNTPNNITSPSPVKTSEQKLQNKIENEKNIKYLKLLMNLPENRTCVDCGQTGNPIYL